VTSTTRFRKSWLDPEDAHGGEAAFGLFPL
jgi:hypothetical protein